MSSRTKTSLNWGIQYVYARSTLFNAQRDGEPARLWIKELKEALDDKWIDDKQRVQFSDLDKKMI